MKKVNSFLIAAMLLASAVSCSESKSSTDETDENKNITLTFAVNRYHSPEIENIILDFNNEDNGYIVEYRDIDVTGNETTNNQQAAYADVDINQAIMKGEIDLLMPDIFISDRSYDSLMRQGAFADLYPFIQNDPDINSSVLDMHMLSLNEHDGKLCDMPLSYDFVTLIGAEKYVGTKENQTLDEFIADWNKMPKGSILSHNNSRRSVFLSLTSFPRFLDESVGKVEFDSPEFLKILKFCETFPADTGEDYEYEYDLNTPNMVVDYAVSGFFPFHIIANYNEGKQCFIGYPSDDGNGGYINFDYYKIAMCSNITEAKQKGAWELMKKFLSEENQEYLCITQIIGNSPCERGFPINKNAFSAIGEKCISGEYHLEPHENSEGFPTTLTKEEYDRLIEYIASINAVNHSVSGSVHEVLSTELEAFFNGKQSAEQTADMLQNRLETMIDEIN